MFTTFDAVAIELMRDEQYMHFRISTRPIRPMISVIRGRDTVMTTSSNFEQLAKGDVHNSQLYTKCVKTNNYITLYSIYSVVVLNTAIIMIGKDSTGARF